MDKQKIIYELNQQDAGQIISALTLWQENWKKTLDWFDGTLDDPYFQILECSNRTDAEEMVQMYERLISTLDTQYTAQLKIL